MPSALPSAWVKIAPLVNKWRGFYPDEDSLFFTLFIPPAFSGVTVLNRSVLILRYKQPFVDWINAADPNPTHTITLAEANEDNNAYLVAVDDEAGLAKWLRANGEILFEEELNEWYTDADLWPQDRSLSLLKKWCTFELHTVVRDTGSEPLFDDEADDAQT